MLGLDQDLIVGYRGVPGNVLQVVNATYGTQTSSSSSTFADTGLTATITPTSASSKVLAMVNLVGCYKDTGNTTLQAKLLRGSTDIIIFETYAGGTFSTATAGVGACSTTYLDSPATTSAVTYKVQFRSGGNVAVVYFNLTSGGITPVSTITLMEVAA